jgi:MoaA/NifB/PqqE/SkfB family radical SAM enzyme
MINTLHIELTTFCNAACPSCIRTVEIKEKNSNFSLLHLDIKKIYDIEKTILKNLKKIQLCGTYGDPILHPHFFKFIDWFIENTTAIIEISTNGQPHKSEWWKKLAEKLNGRGYVIFGLDGLEDTHAIYRRNTDFNKIIHNATNFINVGGRAWWQYIPFKHNEHQIIKAKKLSQKLKFEKFFLKDERMNKGFEPWSHRRVIFNSEQSLEKISERCLFSKGTVYMEANGNFRPCCYMANNTDSKWVYSNLTQENVEIIDKNLQKSWQSIETAPKECQKFCVSFKRNA